MITIRRATPADALGIATVHVASWQETYKGIVPDAFLASLSVAKREAVWRMMLVAPAPQHAAFVATTSSDEIVGFADGGRSREPDTPFGGELWSIYLLRAHQGGGIGRRLFAAVVDHLRRSGIDSMMLWVLRDNPTLAFYQHLGGQMAGSKPIEIGGATLDEVALGWSELPTFN